MKAYGNFDLQQNQLQQAVLPIDVNFPSTPIPGRLAFKDKILYICVDILNGTPAWIPLTQQMDTYVHYQDTAAQTWTVTHGLNMSTPMVQVYDAATGTTIIPDSITVMDQDRVQIHFGTAVTGRAIVMVGQTDGGARPAYAYVYTQASPATTWTIDHMLGYEPHVRVFIGTYEVQPDSIQFPTNNQVVITFTQPQVGVAKLI